MKKTMLLAAAATMLTTGMASAATYGDDPFGTLTLNATAAEFCKITEVSTAGVTAGPPTGSLQQGDAIATLDIQRITTNSATANTIKADQTSIRMNGSQCNTRFRASLGETSFTLDNTEYSGPTPGPEFTLSVPFEAQLEFDGATLIPWTGVSVPASADQGPTFGPLIVRARVKSSDARLVEGDYEGSVIFRLNTF